MRHALSVAVVLAVMTGAAGTLPAADWTDAVFPDRSHDFGTVARGSKVRHSFKVVNTTNEEIHIESFRALCGCTDVKLGAKEIPPGTQSVVEAVIDTTKFAGYKSSGVVLTLDKPSRVEVTLNLSCFIQTTLTLNPGQVDFGVVNRSASPKLELNLSYAGGQANWAVTEMKTVSDHIVAELKEQGRSAGGAVTYLLSVTLRPSAPVGFFKDEITLKTNDPNMPSIPVSVSAVVQSNVTVSPSVINMGRVKPGDSIQKTIVVRSSTPFKIVAAKASRGELTVAPAADQAKGVHSLTFTFKAPSQAGPFNATIEVETDLKGEPIAKVSTFATVVP